MEPNTDIYKAIIIIVFSKVSSVKDSTRINETKTKIGNHYCGVVRATGTVQWFTRTGSEEAVQRAVHDLQPLYSGGESNAELSKSKTTLSLIPV